MPNTLQVHFSSQIVEWATPPELFADLHAEFGFETDVCATPVNAKCATFFTVEDDGLKQKWTGVCWMNPPYGQQIKHWVRKAFESAQQGATVFIERHHGHNRTATERTDSEQRRLHLTQVRGGLKFIEIDRGFLQDGDLLAIRLDRLIE